MNNNNIEIGRKVVYTPFIGCEPEMCEEGVITAFNDKFVFVRYGNDVEAKATRPDQLHYVGGN